MDSKQLVDKFINGEITEEQFETEKAKLTPEDQEALKKEAEAKLPDAVEKLKSVRRGITKIASEKNGEDDKNLTAKIREENLVEAESVFFAEVGIDKDEDITAFKESFKGVDSGSVNVKNIVADMRKQYASMHSEDYLTLLKEKKNREQAAEELNAQNAGSGASGSGGTGGSGNSEKPSKEVQDFIVASAKIGKILTPQEAEHRLALARNKGRIPTS